MVMPLENKQSDYVQFHREVAWAMEWCHEKQFSASAYAELPSHGASHHQSCDMLPHYVTGVLVAAWDRSESRGSMTPIVESREVSASFSVALAANEA